MFSCKGEGRAEDLRREGLGLGLRAQCCHPTWECSGLGEESSDEAHIFKLDIFIFCTQMECS